MELTQVFDTDIRGTLDSNGRITTYRGKQAVENSIVMWLTSFPTDAIRGGRNGGYLVNFLMQPMSEENRQNIVRALQDGFEQDFTPYVNVSTIVVTPMYDTKTWEITVEGYIPEIKDSITSTSLIRNLV
jgi:hypothetical protein